MATKKGSGAKKSSSKQKTQSNVAKKQLSAVLFVAVAVFFLCVVFIKGQNVWLWLHNLVFGIFGITAYYFPFLLGFIAIALAMDKEIKGSVIAKAVEISLIVVFIGAAVDIFSSHNPSHGFWEHLVSAFDKGTHLKSGGFLGALIGQPIYMAFGNPGAAITIILLIFVLLTRRWLR